MPSSSDSRAWDSTADLTRRAVCSRCRWALLTDLLVRHYNLPSGVTFWVLAGLPPLSFCLESQPSQGRVWSSTVLFPHPPPFCWCPPWPPCTHSHASSPSPVTTACSLSSCCAVLAAHCHFIADIIYSHYCLLRISHSASSLSVSSAFVPNTHMSKIYFSYVLFFPPSSAVLTGDEGGLWVFIFKNANALAMPSWATRISPGPAPESVSGGADLGTSRQLFWLGILTMLALSSEAERFIFHNKSQSWCPRWNSMGWGKNITTTK